MDRAAALAALEAELEAQLDQARACVDVNALERWRSAFTGRKSSLHQQYASLRDWPQEQRADAGKRLGAIRSRALQAYEERKQQLDSQQLASKLQERIDVTLPARQRPLGGLHPLTQTNARVSELFFRMGYTIAEGPEIELDYYNFEALNFPENHPARDMHDTFYFDSERLLRTHTSPVQIRTMESSKPPIRVICPGKVYRSDHDRTHSPMFHQVEGLFVDEGVSFADLKGVVIHFLRAFFNSEDLQVRFRPSYFPFTEPSAEVDILLETAGAESEWLEVMGCGLVHPNVLRAGGIDSSVYSGFAFGFGLERLAMLSYQLRDLRLFFQNDSEFLAQFA